MSTVVLDTITGKSTATTITIGSTPVVSASANSMTIRGEGSAQTSIQQGLAKAWVDLNGGTADDSFNIGSDTDVGTGQYSFSFSTNMANVNYSVSGSAGTSSNVMHTITAKDTTDVSVAHRDFENTLTDLVNSMSTIHGDLA